MASRAETVGLFATCLVDFARPEVGFATAHLIEQAGFHLEVPASQTCCGQPHYNSGASQDAMQFARRFVKIFEKFDYVVAPSGSCAAMVRIHYPQLLAKDPDFNQRAQAVASRTHELTQFLTEIADIQLKAQHTTQCTYHDSCSGYRELGVKNQPRELLGQIDGLTLVECRESAACCGFGGTFCVKYPQISANIANEKAQNIEATDADTLLGGDLGCLLNIAGTLRRRGSSVRVFHVAEVLAGQADQPAIGQSRR